MAEPAAPEARLDVRRVLVFTGFAFGLAWAVAYVIYRTGGLSGSPELIPSTGLTLAVVLLALGYMTTPALAHLLTRLVTREGWHGLLLRPRFRAGWRYWAAAWVAPALLTATGGALFYLLFPQHFDPALGAVRRMIEGQPIPAPLRDPRVLVALQVAQGVVLAPVINGVFAFGEEFGWRAYLQPKLGPLGWRRAVLVVGVVWGLWHAPVIAMGHNYGVDYPGAPWAGIAAMTWFCVVYAVVFGWLTERAGSVWPAVIGHGALNGIAGLPALFAQADPNPLLGPLPTGLVAGLSVTLLAAWCWARPPSAAPAAPPAP